MKQEDDNIQHQHIYITFEEYNLLKNPKYNLASSINQFKLDDIDEGVMFYDEFHKFIEEERMEIENIKPKYVLLPRFIFLENIDKLEEFYYVQDNGSKKILSDYLKHDYKLIKNYSLEEESINKLEKEMKELKGGQKCII